eukprot:gene9035-10002_t
MEKVLELLKDLERKDPAEYETKREKTSLLDKYKQEAVNCEQRLEGKRKLKHEQLLMRIASIEEKIQSKETLARQLKDPIQQSGKDSAKQPDGDTTELESSRDGDGSADVTDSSGDKEAELAAGESLMESFSMLEELQNQQTNLETWYKTMSNQLELEQRRLAEKFADMKLKILQKKQHYLQTSQDYLSNLSSEANKVDARYRLDSRPGTAPEFYAREKSTSTSEVQSSSSPNENPAMPSSQRAVNGLNYSGRLETKRRVKLTSDESPFTSESQMVQSSIAAENLTPESKFHGGFSLNESNELVEKTQLISPIQVNSEHLSLQSIGLYSNQLVRQDLLKRYEAVESLSYRNYDGYDANKGQESHTSGNLSHSTPVKDAELLSEKTIDNHRSRNGLGKTVEDELQRSSFDRLGAAAVGYLTRKLLHTPKVQTLIKTIRDTKSVLAGMERDPSSIHKYSTAKAEHQLKANVQQELINAQSKLHRILHESTAKERIEIISKSRLALSSRENLQFYKDKTRPSSSVNKRLSAVSQKTIRRKLENHLNQRNISRPHTSPAMKSMTDGKSTTDGKKQRKAWDIRSQKPTQSDGSPNLVTESQPESHFEEKKLADHAEDKLQSKDVPLKRKTARKRLLAVTLNRKSTTTG